MTEFKVTLCLALLTLVGAPALAHDAPVPHDHSHESGLALWVAAIAMLALVASASWRRIKRKAE